MRICATAWLKDNAPPEKVVPTQLQDITTTWKVVPTVSKRIELITGLSTQYKPVSTDAEPFQLVNYGLGGQYETHTDFAKHNPSKHQPEYLWNSGERMATFMLYLTHVEAGGATVFPHLNIQIPPIQNAAAFWFNIKPSGELDKRTAHAGCPVLLGEKWVANKWIREYGQMFRRPC